jgi:hypothetical protein
LQPLVQKKEMGNLFLNGVLEIWFKKTILYREINI